jgi:signal transduction histidine kinase
LVLSVQHIESREGFRPPKVTASPTLPARPGTIQADLTPTNESVVDDGIGFVPDCGTGLGLRSIDECGRLAKGNLTVESQPGRGTSLLVRIPLAAAQRELVRVRTE